MVQVFVEEAITVPQGKGQKGHCHSDSNASLLISEPALESPCS
jgi:hypothetical protein